MRKTSVQNGNYRPIQTIFRPTAAYSGKNSRKWEWISVSSVNSHGGLMVVKDLSKLPRERLKTEGPEALSTADLLALILGRGTAKKDVFSLAGELSDFLSGMSRRPTLEELEGIEGLGSAKSSQILACLELSSRFFLGSRMISVTSPGTLVPQLAFLKFKRQECFVTVSLSGCNGILGVHVITDGLVDKTQVHAREVFAEAIRDRASSIIVAHNHPSGSLMASQEDKWVTKSLTAAGKLLEIPVLDHLIVSFRGYTSLKRESPELF